MALLISRHGLGRGVRALLLLLLALPLARGTAVPVAADPLQVKAAFLLNFAAFVEWPPQAFADNKETLVVGVHANEAFESALRPMLVGESVQGRAFAVRQVRGPGDVPGCHLLYVEDASSREGARVLAAAGDLPVLTVGEGRGFNEAGGIIEFVTERDRIRFRINRRAGLRVDLRLSSKLLRLAQHVIH